MSGAKLAWSPKAQRQPRKKPQPQAMEKAQPPAYVKPAPGGFPDPAARSTESDPVEDERGLQDGATVIIVGAGMSSRRPFTCIAASVSVTSQSYMVPRSTSTTSHDAAATDSTRSPGPAGIGMAALLEQAEVNCVVLERGSIGESFLRWPAETKFICK